MQNILREYYSVMYSTQNCLCCHVFFLVVELKEKVVDVVGKVANWIGVMFFFWQLSVSHNVQLSSQIASQAMVH